MSLNDEWFARLVEAQIKMVAEAKSVLAPMKCPDVAFMGVPVGNFEYEEVVKILGRAMATSTWGHKEAAKEFLLEVKAVIEGKISELDELTPPATS